MTDMDNTERIGGGAIASNDHKPASDTSQKGRSSSEAHLERSSPDYNPDAALIQNVLNAFEAFERRRR